MKVQTHMTQSHPTPDLRLIPPATRQVIERVALLAKEHGVSLYFAGGVVRDLLLRRPIKDVDLVVEGDAIELARSLARTYGGKVTAHGKFGTATWALPPKLRLGQESHGSLDLAQARTETYPLPGALPVVAFATIEEDLRRRDFTINAMALRLHGGEVGELIDPFGGRQDLKQRLIRALHERSFVDDPTRMLRALRYADRYGFEIAPETKRLFNEEALRLVGSLSGERLRHELDLILEETHPARILQQAQKLGLLDAIDSRLPVFDARLENLLDPGPDEGLEIGGDRSSRGHLLWLAELPPDAIPEVSRRLAFDGALERALRAAARLLRDMPGWEGSKPSEWTEWLDRLPPAAIEAIHLRTGEPALGHYLRTWRHIQPRANGEELKRRGLEPGPAFRTILEGLRSAWLDGEVSDEQEEAALLDRLLKDRSGRAQGT